MTMHSLTVYICIDLSKAFDKTDAPEKFFKMHHFYKF